MTQEPTVPVIDLELGAKLVGGKREVAEEMIAMLIECLPEHQAEIDAAYTSQEIVQLAQAIHKLHGAASYCGTPRLKEAAKELELAARSNEINKIKKLYQQLNQEIAAVLDS